MSKNNLPKPVQPKEVPTPVGNGYPVNPPKKTRTYRGAGAITKAKTISDRDG